MKRRDFIKLSSVGAVGVALPTNLLGSAFTLNELTNGSQFDVIIIGTGYGASVSALRLAEQGVRCLMLEMGMDWDKEGAKFSNHVVPTKESTWVRNTTNFPFFNYAVFEKYTGALDSFDFDNGFGIYMGRGVGGGSLVNGGMYIEPLKAEFQKAFPSLDVDLFYDKYFPIAKENLTASEVPDECLAQEPFRFARVGKEEFTKAGYKHFKMLSNYDKQYLKDELAGKVEGSATKQELFYGNNAGKKDLRKTYLSKALETGNVSILALHEVEQIIEKENGSFDLKVKEINTKGQRVASKTYNTSKLFLGAGSIGTTKLLLKSQYLGTLTVDDKVGKKWGQNGNLNTVRALMPKAIGERQATVPTYGVDAWDQTDEAFIAELGALPAWIDPRSVAYIFVSRVKHLAEMYYNPTKDRIEIDFDDRNWDVTEGAAKKFLEKLSEVNGGGTSNLGEIINRYGWHLLGGCVLNYATDEFGRLNTYDNIYITDSSLIPGQIGVNPFGTITAVAEYLIEHIIKEDFGAESSTPAVEAIQLIAAPNPFRHYINLRFNSNKNQTVRASIINWAGRVVADTEFEATEGQNNYRWNGLGYLWREAYTLKLEVGNQFETTRVVRASWWW